MALASNADAQIYAWRDARGNLVLSDRPTDPNAQTFAVPRAATVRATKPLPQTYSGSYDQLIDEHASVQGVRPDLVRAVIQVESDFNPRARSPKGALGLMQLMPATVAEYGVVDPFDAADNIRAGVAYLRRLLSRYDESEELALAAYNAGPNAVDRYRQHVPPYRETRQYVSRIRTATGRAAASALGRIIYKTIDLIDGRPVPRYSNSKPKSGSFEIVAAR